MIGNDPSKWPDPEPVQASNARHHRVDVQRLLAYFDHGKGETPPLPGWTPEVNRAQAQVQGRMYVRGVLDAFSDDPRLCIAAFNLPPHEVEDEVVAAIRNVPQERNAAAAVRDAALIRFPCNP